MSEYSFNDCIAFKTCIGKSNYSTAYKNYILQRFKLLFKYAQEIGAINQNLTINLKNFKKNEEDIKKDMLKEEQIWQ